MSYKIIKVFCGGFVKITFFRNGRGIISSIFFAVFCFCFSLHAHKQVVLVLNGASSSGKTSIADELMMRLTDEMQSEPNQTFVLLKADAFEEKDADAVQDDHGHFITTQRSFLQEIKKQVLAENSVIVDGIFTEQEQKLLHSMLDEYAYVHIIAVYCSPRDLVDHVQQRNLLHVPSEQRSVYQAACDLSELWRICISPTKHVVDAIDELSFSDLAFIVDQVQQELFAEVSRESSSTESGVYSPSDRQFVEVTLASLKTKLASGFDRTPISSPVFMSPRGNPFLVVNAGRSTSAGCAEQIIEKIKSATPKE